MSDSHFKTIQVRPKIHGLVVEESARRKKRNEPNSTVVDVAGDAIMRGLSDMKQQRKEGK